MDKECIELCNTLNYLEGIETSEMGYPKYWSSEIFKKYFNKNK